MRASWWGLHCVLFCLFFGALWLQARELEPANHSSTALSSHGSEGASQEIAWCPPPLSCFQGQARASTGCGLGVDLKKVNSGWLRWPGRSPELALRCLGWAGSACEQPSANWSEPANRPGLGKGSGRSGTHHCGVVSCNVGPVTLIPGKLWLFLSNVFLGPTVQV